MKRLMGQWEELSERMNARAIRERILITCSILLVVYLVWDFGFYQPLAETRDQLKLRYEASNKDLVLLSAEEEVFVKALASDPGAAKKREVVHLEQQLQNIDTELEELAVGLIPAENLPAVLHDVLLSSHSLKFLGMQTRPVEQLQFKQEPDADDGVESANLQSDEGENNIEEEGAEEKSAEEKRIVGVYKHTVTISFEGSFFNVLAYLNKLESLQWKIYWDFLDYEVISFPKARVSLEVFTLSTQRGMLGA